MFKHRNKVCASILVALTVLILIISVPQAKAQFVLASWTGPDEYGNGFNGFEVYGNSTGSWVQVGGAYNATDAHDIEWEVGVGIKLRCWTFLNSTKVGATDTADGKNYLQHNVTVTNFGETIFSQQNFTYFFVSDTLDPIWLYGYEVVLNFIPEYGQIYTVTIIYEVYY